MNEKLKDFRLSNRLSQKEMADLMSISPSQYSKIESGKSSLNLHHLETLANSLRQDFNQVYTLLNEMSEEENREQKDITGASPVKPDLLLPSVTVSFEDALSKLGTFCISHQYSLEISSDGSIHFNKEAQ